MISLFTACLYHSATPDADDHLSMMLFLSSLKKYLLLIGQALAAPVTDRRRWYGVLLLWLLLPVYLLLQLLHWLGFLLDELLFPGYRRVEIREPLFVLGPPRSGTTHLHHVLAGDERRTTFRAWECLFGLSVTARRLILALVRLDSLLGRPLGRLFGWLESRLLAGAAEIHPVSLDGPEEDFLTLLPLAQCFLLIVPFPRARWLWRTARLDRDVPDRERRRLLRWYRRCIQKHLYVHGEGRLFLSKNASFAGMAGALLEEFPDARILCCMREPEKVIASQLSSLRPGLKFCGFTSMEPELRDDLVDLLHFYYRNLADVAGHHPQRMAIIHNRDMHHRLSATLLEALRQVGLPADRAFADRLEQAAVQSRRFRSAHHYSLEEFGLEPESVRQRFDPVYQYFAQGAPADGSNRESD